MRIGLRQLMCVTLLLTPPSSIFAQKRACPVPPPSPFKHTGNISTRLDKTTDSMRTILEHPVPLTRGAERVFLSASFAHQDPRRASAPTLELTIISVSVGEKYRASHDLVLSLDGQRRSYVGLTNYQSRANGGTMYETAQVKLSFEDVQVLTHSRQVTAHLGLAEFAFSHNHLEALRELASLMAPSPSRWRTTE
jgi:hypothetical protein